MISKNRIKQIQSLKTRKGRIKERLFLIEGSRCIQSYLGYGNELEKLFMTESFTLINKNMIKLCNKKEIPHTIVSDKVMKVISDTKTPSGVLGICKYKYQSDLDLNSKRWLYLNKISDPGNLGAILRSAAWFNIKNIALSKNSADPYAPKVVRSATGAHLHLNIHQGIDYKIYFDHDYFLIGADQNSTYTMKNLDYNKKLVLVLGNESEGIGISIKKKMDKLISVKRLGYGESLNVAIAGSIIMNELTKK